MKTIHQKYIKDLEQKREEYDENIRMMQDKMEAPGYVLDHTDIGLLSYSVNIYRMFTSELIKNLRLESETPLWKRIYLEIMYR